MMEGGKCEIHSKASGRSLQITLIRWNNSASIIQRAANFLIYFLISLLYQQLFFFFNFVSTSHHVHAARLSHCTRMPRTENELDNVQRELSLSFTYVTLCLSLGTTISISDPDFSITA